MTPESIIEYIQNYSDNLQSELMPYLDNLQAVANTITNITLPTVTDYGDYDTISNALSALKDDVPQAPDIDNLPTDLQTSISLEKILVSDITIPDDDVGQPNLDTKDVPSIALEELNLNVPSFDLERIEKPDISYPAEPSEEDFSLPQQPEKPALQWPAFNSTLPSFTEQFNEYAKTVTLPTLTPESSWEDQLPESLNSELDYQEVPFNEEIDITLIAKLLSDLSNGTYGIESTDELMLTQRLKDNSIYTANKAIEDINKTHAAFGFPIPTGARNAAIRRAQQEVRDRLLESMRDIYIKRAELHFAARQHTIDSAIKLDEILRRWHNSVQDRALLTAKTAIEASHTVFDLLLKNYNARVALYSAKVDAYRAQIQAFDAETMAAAETYKFFDSKIRLYGAKVQVYQTQAQVYGIQVEAERIKQDTYRIDVEAYANLLQAKQILIELYRERLNAVQIKMNIYKTELEAQKTYAEAHMTSLEQLKYTIQEYQTHLDFKRLEFEAFKASLEKGKMQLQEYETKVQAFQTKMEAARLKSEIAKNQAEAKYRNEQLTIEQYKVQLDAHTSKINAIVSNNKTIIDKYDAELKRYIEQVRASTEIARLGIEAYKTKADLEYRKVETDTKNIEVQLQQFNKETDSKTEAAKAIATIVGEVTKGAANSFNAISAIIKSES
ncbi:MAG: hypothetical protein L3V56_05330 [Candidatus Magnetoovum sp. WYHC-5]|nr:hypothetical protein [Candidatus Magnetoovum sp. WYHC-5]